MTFQLHPQLATDTGELGRAGSIRVLLHRSALLPWFILVPETHYTELHDLPPALNAELQAVAQRVGRFVLRHFACDKLNVAAIGNVVPQLHLHVIGRRRDDPLWPGVVWGNVPNLPQRDPAAIAEVASALRAASVLD